MADFAIPAGVLPAHRDLYCGGAWHAPMASGYITSLAPATGEPIAEAPVADAADVDAAVQAANAALAPWRRTTPAERGQLLRQAAEVLRRHADELVLLDALDTGNPVTMLAGDARFAANGLDYFAGLATEVKGQTIPMGDGNLKYTVREPMGVIARIVAETVRKVGVPFAPRYNLPYQENGRDRVEWRVIVELSSTVGAKQVHEVLVGGNATPGCSAATLGLSLAEAKSVLAGLQRHHVQTQVENTARSGDAALDVGDSGR